MEDFQEQCLRFLLVVVLVMLIYAIATVIWGLVIYAVSLAFRWNLSMNQILGVALLLTLIISALKK